LKPIKADEFGYRCQRNSALTIVNMVVIILIAIKSISTKRNQTCFFHLFAPPAHKGEKKRKIRRRSSAYIQEKKWRRKKERKNKIIL
jgi:hypothetical protein